jgi:lipoate-protein ligase A
VLHVFLDDACDGPTNMARDEHLLYSQSVRPAAVRLYAWSPPAISLGYFQRHSDVAELPADVRELAVVRRLTGGGAILHDREITYCITVDDAHSIGRQGPTALYRLAHQAWREVLAAFGRNTEMASDELPFPSPRTGPFFCFQRPGRTDLLLGGEKVLGSAQRRIAGRVLQHGSLILGRRFASHPGTHLGDPPSEDVLRWRTAFAERVAEALGLAIMQARWTPNALKDVQERRRRYDSEEWTRRR